MQCLKIDQVYTTDNCLYVTFMHCSDVNPFHSLTTDCKTLHLIEFVQSQWVEESTYMYSLNRVLEPDQFQIVTSPLLKKNKSFNLSNNLECLA